MIPATALDGPGSSARRRKRRTWVIVGVLVAIVSVAAVVAVLPSSSPSSKSSSSGRLGPYSLGLVNNTTLGLAFPLCSVVTVHWTDGGGGNATFVVLTPAEVQPSACTAPPPAENTTCPSDGCPSYMDGSIVCIESGTGGSCAFLSTQANYTFLNYVPYDSTVWTSVTFTARYSPSGDAAAIVSDG
ncbi:MAG: hypothetical protein WBW47_01940 [Thermoplasmata archaeon]